MQNTLEEMALTQHSNEQEQQPEPPETTASSEPEEAKPETQEQEVTALIPAEPEVIEGEFVEIEPQETTEDHRPPKQKPYWLLIPFTILFCLVFVAASFLFPLLTPSATVTIIPVERNITLTTYHRPGCAYSGWKSTELRTSHGISTCGSYRPTGEYTSL